MLKRIIKNILLPNKTAVLSIHAHQLFISGHNMAEIKFEELFRGEVNSGKNFNWDNCNNVARSWIIFPVFLFAMNEVSVKSDTNVVFMISEKKYIVETSWGWAKYSTVYLSRFNKLNFQKISSNSPVFIFSGKGYHGLTEYLSIVLLLVKRRENFSIAISRTNTWMISLLDFFLKGSVRYIFIKDNKWISGVTFLLTTKSHFGEFVHPKLIQILNEFSNLNKVGNANACPPKIFISRGDTDNRRSGHEKRIEEIFCNHGFEIIELGGLCIRDQINLFQNAVYVAGIHGAGFANLVWSLGEVKVLELYYNLHFNSCYSSICRILNHKYTNFSLGYHFNDTLNESILKFTVNEFLHNEPTPKSPPLK